MARLIPDSISNKMSLLNLILAKVADYLTETYDAEILFLPMYVGNRHNYPLFSRFSGFMSSNDDKTCYIIQSKMKHPYKSHIISGEYTQAEVAAIIGSLKFLIGIPLHSLIISIIMNVPVLGLIYLPKVKQLLEKLDILAYGINVEHIEAELDYENFIQIIELILKNYEELKLNLENSTKQLRQKSKENYQFLTGFLK